MIDVNVLIEKNVLDIAVLVVIGILFLIGLSSGFIFSAFRIFSSFVALLLSLAFYDRIAYFVYGTYAETVIRTFISDGFSQNPQIGSAQRLADASGVLDGIRDSLRLPTGVAEVIFKLPAESSEISTTELFGDADLIGYFSSQATRAVISIVSVIVLFSVIRVLLSIAKIFLDEIAAQKIFRMFNFIGGPVIGLVEGAAVVYIALTLLMVLNIVIQFEPIYRIIEASHFARGMYERNLFLNFILSNMRFSP